MKNENEKTAESGKGLDIGTAFLKAAEKGGDDIIFKSQRNAFFEVEHNDFIKNILNNSGVKYIHKENKLHVVGNDALEFANMFNKEVRRPLSRGVINPREEEALPMVELLIKNLVGEPSHDGEIIYFSVPGEPLDAEFNTIYHQNVASQFLKKLGYTPKPINEGYAIILSELANDNFTGLALSFGAGMVNVCFSFKAVPVFSFSIAKGGDWIDQQVSMVVNETSSKVCAIKESSLDLTKHDYDSKVESALSVFYNHLIEYLIENMKQELKKAKNLPQLNNPITVVLSGGTSSPKGFDVRFKEILQKSNFPLAIGEVKMASSPLRAVAKGALVAALADKTNA